MLVSNALQMKRKNTISYRRYKVSNPGINDAQRWKLKPCLKPGSRKQKTELGSTEFNDNFGILFGFVLSFMSSDIDDSVSKTFRNMLKDHFAVYGRQRV